VFFRCAAVILGLVPFACVEGLVRYLDWGRVSEKTDPYIGFTAIHPLFVRNAAGDRFEIDASRLALFYPDSFDATKDATEYRIFCLGGSTVQGSPYTIETSFTTWLELSLKAADPTRKWQVVNCGGLSYASYRLVPILQEVLQYAPDLIIIYTGQNEFLESRSYQAVLDTPRAVALAHAWCSRWRTYNLCHEGWLRLQAKLFDSRDPCPTTLAADVDALLDHSGGLADYHRDDAWRRAAVQHFEYNLTRMARLCREARVPLLLANPVANLKDCPPFKAANREDLSADQLAEFESLWNRAQSFPQRQRYEPLELLEQARRIDDRHAGVHFLLGDCYLAGGRVEEAKAAFVRAKDEDICPLRILEPMYDALARVVKAHDVACVDVRGLFERQSPEGIPGKELMIDHVHPTISGHQMIARAMLEEMVRRHRVLPQPGWELRQDQSFKGHLTTLDAPYYARGKERLAGQRKWVEGRARTQTRSKP
jgi:lysophospholipase L1-like esterase